MSTPSFLASASIDSITFRGSADEVVGDQGIAAEFGLEGEVADEDAVVAVLVDGVRVDDRELLDEAVFARIVVEQDAILGIVADHVVVDRQALAQHAAQAGRMVVDVDAVAAANQDQAFWAQLIAFVFDLGIAAALVAEQQLVAALMAMPPDMRPRLEHLQTGRE